jgi:UDP-N-acetylglucosamine 2-epimerase (hydrolysing)
LTILKNANFILGNSSVGVREAPIYGVPSVIVGTRQLGRTLGILYDGFFQFISPDEKKILPVIQKLLKKFTRFHPVSAFGDGKSVSRFLEVIKSDELWLTGIQKIFSDYNRKPIKQLRKK